MPEQIATFMKIPEEQFILDYNIHNAKDIYDNIQLPARATTGSAGYDFYLPYDISIKANEKTLVYTGVRVNIDKNWALFLYPRSGFGIKYGFRLFNTVGIVDSDYFGAKNYGHIIAAVTADRDLELKKGDRFIQGIFMPYGIAKNDHILIKTRDGGFGSTGGI